MFSSAPHHKLTPDEVWSKNFHRKVKLFLLKSSKEVAYIPLIFARTRRERREWNGRNFWELPNNHSKLQRIAVKTSSCSSLKCFPENKLQALHITVSIDKWMLTFLNNGYRNTLLTVWVLYHFFTTKKFYKANIVPSFVFVEF